MAQLHPTGRGDLPQLYQLYILLTNKKDAFGRLFCCIKKIKSSGEDKHNRPADLLNAIAFEVVRIVQNVPILYVLYENTKLFNTINANRYTAFRSNCGQIVVRCPRADTPSK